MKKISVVLLMLLVIAGCKRKQIEKERMCSRIDLERILSLIPQNVDEVKELGLTTKKSMQDMLTDVNNIVFDERTFANTIRPYDRARFEFIMNKNILSTMGKLAQNQEVQVAARGQDHKLIEYQEQVMHRNGVLYQAFKEYSEHGKDVIKKAIATRFFLQKKFQEFKKDGASLPVAQQAEVVELEKEIEQLSSQYCSNISHDSRNIIVPVKDLKGVSKEFIQTLNKDFAGNYVVPVNQKSFDHIMQHCLVEKTRKEYFLAFGQRAYPQNVSVLQELLVKQYDLARKVGFHDYAEYQLHTQSLKQAKRVEQFIWPLVVELQKQDALDFAELTKELPPSVVLKKDGKIKPWDMPLVTSWYEKKHFKVIPKLFEYFELESTMQKMFKLFHRLFHIEFEKQDVLQGQLWADDVTCYRIRSLHNQAIIGYVFLDLYKRPGKVKVKTSHMMLVPTIKDDCSISCVGASVLAAHYSQPTEERQTLLGLDDVTELFKQFGYALHDVFGAACYVDYSGTQTSQDFMNVPAQVLQMWLHDPEILHSLSQHYKDGHKLSKDKITNMIAVKKFAQAQKYLHEAFVALVSLHVLKDHDQKDIHKLVEKIYKKVFNHIAYDGHAFYEYNSCSVGSHGALAYTDLWSNVAASDLYDHMQQAGMKYEVGEEYIKHILNPGGFGAPVVMIKKFLKRPMNSQAFLKRLVK